MFDRGAGQYLLFGNRWLVPGDAKSIELLHLYDHDGNFIKSEFPFDERWQKLNLTHSDKALLATDEVGNCFIALPFEPVVWEEKSGTLSKIEMHLPDFRVPTIALPEDIKALKNFHTWELTFTPIRGLYAIGGNILIEYETDKRLRYTVVIVKIGSNTPFRTFQTNWLLIGGDHHGTVALINNPGKKTGDHIHVALAHLKFE